MSLGVRMELLLPVPGCGKLPINLCEDYYDKSFHLLSVHVPSTGLNEFRHAEWSGDECGLR